MWGPRRGFALGPRGGLCPWTPLGAPPPNPWPAFEKAGENQLVNFFGFPAECAGPPLIGSGGHPTAPCYPTPTAPLAVLRRLPGGAGRLGRTPGGRRRLAGPAAPWGRRAAKQNSEPGAKGPGLAISGRFASSRRPPPPGFPPTPKRQRKPPAPLRPTREKVVAAASLFPRGMARETLSERGTATAPSPRQSRCPCPTGSGGFIRPAAGYGLRPPAPAVARFSPPAKGRRPRRAAARVGPPSAQGSYRTAHPPLPRGVRSAILINNQYYEMRFTI